MRPTVEDEANAAWGEVNRLRAENERLRQGITVYTDPSDAPLTAQDGQIIGGLMDAAYKRMEHPMTRDQAIERMRQIAVEQKRLADELVSLYGLIEGGDSTRCREPE
jgi:hypothetical protein